MTVAAVAALTFVTPAVAQDTDADAGRERALARLEDPATADAVAALAQGLARALMAMPVGEIAGAVRRIDPDSSMADVPADATLGDLADTDDADIEQLGDDAHASTRMAGTMARQMAAMLPVFRAMARDMAAQWDAARRDSRHR